MLVYRCEFTKWLFTKVWWNGIFN